MSPRSPAAERGRKAPLRLKSWRERLREFRTRLIRNPAFQSWAAAFPFTRPRARREARALFDLCAGFVYSQVLAAFVQVRLPEYLANGPLPLEVLARLTNLDEAAISRLMRAATALRLARMVDEDHYGLGDLGASLVGNPAIAHFIAHHALLYADLSDPVALLRGQTPTQLSQFWPYSGSDPDQPAQEPIPADRWGDYAAYSDLMAQSQQLVAQDILHAYPLAEHRRLLDVGGGEGRFIAEAAAQCPRLELQLFDLPPVAERARQALKIRGLDQRVQFFAGDFLRDTLPFGADIISLVRILHDHDDKSVQLLLRAAYAALPKGGKLLIAEPMSDTPGAEPIGDAYFGFYLLAMGRGRPRRPAELKLLLEAAGFGQIRTLPTRRPILISAMIAKKV